MSLPVVSRTPTDPLLEMHGTKPLTVIKAETQSGPPRLILCTRTCSAGAVGSRVSTSSGPPCHAFCVVIEIGSITTGPADVHPTGKAGVQPPSTPLLGSEGGDT